MNLRATKIKEYDTKEMKRLIQNTDLKVTIHDTGDHKYLTVFWKTGYPPEEIYHVFKKKMTKRFAIRVCNWFDKMYGDIKEPKGWREYLRDTIIKEYEPV